MSKKKIVALGDSITKGILFANEGAKKFNYTLCDNPFIRQVANQLDAEEINLGKMGCTIVVGEQILDRNMAKIVGAEYAVVCFGGNDSDYNWKQIAADRTKNHAPKTNLETFVATYIRIIEKLKDAQITPILLSLPPIDAQRYFDFFTCNLSTEGNRNIIEWLNGSIQTIKKGHDLYNDAVKSIACSTKTKLIDITQILGIGRDYLCMDGIHPTSVAHSKIAEQINLALS